MDVWGDTKRQRIKNEYSRSGGWDQLRCSKYDHSRTWAC